MDTHNLRRTDCEQTVELEKRPLVGLRTKDPAYHLWYQMKKRCTDPKHPKWKWYGGKGVRMHPVWVKSFELFLKDIGPRPGPQHSIDRIDVTRGYEPGNVRWATYIQQAQNKRIKGINIRQLKSTTWEIKIGRRYATKELANAALIAINELLAKLPQE
jgi:hypothetical protein